MALCKEKDLRSMTVHDRHRLERHARRVEELRLWRNAREQPVAGWRFTARGKEYYVSPGDPWPETEVPVRFRARTFVPEEWAGEPVELELWLGGEGFVKLSNGVSGGLDPFHRSFRVAEKARGGEEIEVEAEVVPKGLTGATIADPRLVRAALVVPEKDVRALERDLSVIVKSCASLDDHETVPLLLDVLDAAFAALSPFWPTETGVSLTRYLEGFTDQLGDLPGLPPSYAKRALEGNWASNEPWSLPPAPGPLEPLPEQARRVVREARRIVVARTEKIKKDYPPVGRLALTGHAHLDLAWLWPAEESRRKARRTFASVLGLMDRNPEFAFNQSSAQMYLWVEEDDPELFERVRERVAQGQWEPVGGSWVEPDCQLPGGESFVRQLLYGQRYFEEKFGRRSAVAWLPDTFGFSPAIPQLLRGAGIEDFFTYKLNWSETNRFPHDLFVWEGLGGSQVTAHTFDNPGTDYNGDVAPHDLLGIWRNFMGKRRHPESLFSFGWGDGGGGPTEQMLENYARLKDFPAMPRLRMSRVDEFFSSLPEKDLSKWVGELYLELHRGTLTTQAKVKKLNREAEHRLLEAEAFSTIAYLHSMEYPAEEIEHLWKIVLFNQFHDILPGTSISEVYEDAHRQLEGVVARAEHLRDAALQRSSGSDKAEEVDAVLVANSGTTPRSLSVLLPNNVGNATEAALVTDTEGKRLPVQKLDEGIFVHDPAHQVPGLGWTTIYVSRNGSTPDPGETYGSVGAGGLREGALLENDLLRVEIGADGTLHRTFDKELGREVLSGRGNQLLAYTDKPPNWDAWDIDEDYELEGEEVSGEQTVEVTETGPLRASVRVERRWRSSRIVQTYQLHSGSRRLDIHTEIDWHERQVLLRALFPLNVRSHEATFETMYGSHRRPTHRNTTWDSTRFEVSAHRWADLSEPGYGVALLNDGKYGHSAKDNVLGLSLLRSPLYPDPLADEGYHHFTYSLFPHPKDWTQAGVEREAFALNSPLVVEPGGRSPSEFGFMGTEGTQLMLGTLKKAEDSSGVILRLYEPHGARGQAALRFSHRMKRMEKTDLLEKGGQALGMQADTVHLAVRPFEVITLRLEPEHS